MKSTPVDVAAGSEWIRTFDVCAFEQCVLFEVNLVLPDIQLLPELEGGRGKEGRERE